jgi:hypothetical protein
MLDEIDQTLSCESLFEEFSVLFSEIKEKQPPISIQNRLNAVISRYVLFALDCRSHANRSLADRKRAIAYLFFFCDWKSCDNMMLVKRIYDTLFP